MNLYVFGNGNLPFERFLAEYAPVLDRVTGDPDVEFLVCDFRGTDTLAMEFLKCRTAAVSVFHVGERPRYLPDRYRTKVSAWTLRGGFESDDERDDAAIAGCTHFLAWDGNRAPERKSGTARIIERCLAAGRISVHV